MNDPRFGKVEPCPNNTQRFDFAKMGIHPDERAGLTWESLSRVPGVQEIKAALDELSERGHGWVFLWGGPGQAKSRALKIIVNQLLGEGLPAIYTTMSDVFENLRAVYGDYVDKRQTAETRLDHWTAAPMLALDEFEKGRSTEFSEEKRFALVDKRYMLNIERKVGMTVFASNADPQTFPPYVRSRIFDGRCKVVELAGVDMRPAMQWEKS